jgi:hypothetical protein
MWIDLRGTVLNAGLHRVNLEAVALIESGRLYGPSGADMHADTDPLIEDPSQLFDDWRVVTSVEDATVAKRLINLRHVIAVVDGPSGAYVHVAGRELLVCEDVNRITLPDKSGRATEVLKPAC